MLKKETVNYPSCTCSWCGGVRLSKTGKKSLYKFYNVKEDSLSGRKDLIKGLFCSASCMKSYSY